MQHLPAFFLYSSCGSAVNWSKKKLKVLTLQLLERSGPVKPELLLLSSVQREKLLGPAGCLIHLVPYVFVYILMWKREEEKSTSRK